MSLLFDFFLCRDKLLNLLKKNFQKIWIMSVFCVYLRAY